MMTRILIGLTGIAMSGKDTVAGHLYKQDDFFRMGFADPLRDGLKAMFHLVDWHFTPEGKEIVVEWIGKTPRELMQTLGEEWGRQLVHRHIWIRHLERRMKPKVIRGQPGIITDVRHVEEARLIHSNGGQIWRVIRPGAATTAHSDHTSEQEAHRIVADVDLVNDGTLEQLFEQVDEAYSVRLDEVEEAQRLRMAV